MDPADERELISVEALTVEKPLIHSRALKADGEDGDACRICRGEGTIEQSLFYPCKCSGSIKFVHQDCLMEWLAHSQKKYCELCKTPFRFTKLYDNRMPDTLPLPLFIQQLTVHALRSLLTWSRFLMVGFVWLGWLPWSIRQVWRGLFWLADGSWGTVDGSDDLKVAASTVSNATSLSQGLHAVIQLGNSSIQDGGLPRQTPLSGFLGLLPSEFLLIKVVRFASPSLFRWTSDLLSAVADGNATLSVTYEPDGRDRQPSLLSDVAHFKSLTPHPLINNTIVDALEGQLICLSIITAFILMFLIREWVINHQPAGNVPDPERPVEAAVPAAPDAEPAQRLRRRRRGLRDLADRHPQEARRPLALQARQRLIPPGNDAADRIRVEAPRPAPHASPEAVENDALQASRRASLNEDEDVGVAAGPAVDARPTLQTRNALDSAAVIQRSIEETHQGSTIQDWPGIKVFKDLWNRAGGEPAEVLRIIGQENREDELGWIIEHMQKLQADQFQNEGLEHAVIATATKERHQDARDILFRFDEHASPREDSLSPAKDELGILSSDLADVDQVLPSPEAKSQPSTLLDEDSQIHPIYETTSIHDTTSVSTINNAASAEVTVVDKAASSASDDSDVNMADTPSSDEIEGRHTSTSEGLPTEEDDPHAYPDPVLGPQPLFELVAEWMWHTDHYISPAEESHAQDDEAMIPDIDREAPFVPVQQPAGLEVENENVPEPQDPEVAAAAAEAGIDLNNPAPVEDMEDLDGLLELIGMQGPIAGMVQNVIFCEFLITLTIAASIWLPYIWGKIALLVLANPIGIFVKAPLHLVSKMADTAVDLLLFVSGLVIYIANIGLHTTTSILRRAAPGMGFPINTSSLSKKALSLATGSGTRLEKSMFGTMLGLKPDLPTFSIMSHQALGTYKEGLANGLRLTGQVIAFAFYSTPAGVIRYINAPMRKNIVLADLAVLTASVRKAYQQVLYQNGAAIFAYLVESGRTWSLNLGLNTPPRNTALDYSLVRWSTQDRVIAILLGYAFFSALGFLYLRISRYFLGLKPEEKMAGIVADGLLQAGGVMKVVLIIGIEMIVFPLYCGLLLDLALMPLFGGINWSSRMAFITESPLTALFVHWFIGTCYMFHFALFVSMCRKIMRRGVLYFIRDPDDPTFHPVRDVLERSVTTQLGKIAFSAFVYGGLVMVCLGGVVWGLRIVHGVLPIQWTTDEPRLEFPIDLIFYNFLLPILIRKLEPSKKLHMVYAWWFRRCARWLRLTHFLFNETMVDERGSHVRCTWAAMLHRKQGDVNKPVLGEAYRLVVDDPTVEAYFYSDGKFVRAPGSDSVRIPKGERVFVEVTAEDERIDGEQDEDDGPHGRKNRNFTMVYIPPDFRARIGLFVLLVWLFASVTGVTITIIPLLVGRHAIGCFARTAAAPNDLYAFTVGLCLFGSVAYAATSISTWRLWLVTKVHAYFADKRQMLPRLFRGTAHMFGLAYLGVTFGIVLPLAFSMLAELYLFIPLSAYLMPSAATGGGPQFASAKISLQVSPTVHIIQTWVLGLFYLRFVLRLATTYPNNQTRASVAIRSIVRDGLLRPDVTLATRAFILPASLVSALLIMTPLGLGMILDSTLQISESSKVYRYAYPGVMAGVLVVHCMILLNRQFADWRVRIRDEVYLIGERLHNFESRRRMSVTTSRDKGKHSAGVPDRVDVN